MASIVHNNSGASNDVLEMSNESTNLIDHGVESQLSAGSDGSDTQQSHDTDLWDEMDAPWPATFERAISLLASPVIETDRAKEFTKSPKPGNSPLAIRNRLLVSYHFVSTFFSVQLPFLYSSRANNIFPLIPLFQKETIE